MCELCCGSPRNPSILCSLSLLHPLRQTSSYVTAAQQSFSQASDSCDGLQAPNLTVIKPRLASTLKRCMANWGVSQAPLCDWVEDCLLLID